MSRVCRSDVTRTRIETGNRLIVKSKAVLECDIGFAFFIQANLDCLPCIVFQESCVLVTQSQCREFVKRNILESISIYIISNHYFFCNELTRKVHVAFNSNSSGTYNSTFNSRIVDISKVDVVFNIDKQIALVFVAACRRGLATAGLDKDFGVDS